MKRAAALFVALIPAIAAAQASAAPPAARPTTAAGSSASRTPLGTPVGSEFDPRPIVESVRQKEPELRGCYEASPVDPTVNVDGTFEISFVVAANGSVRSALIVNDGRPIYSPLLSSCVAAVLSRLHFVPPADAHEHQMKAPFHLQAEAAASTESRDEGSRPAGTHVERRRIKALWLTGLIVDLGLWAIRAGTTMAICASYSSDMHGCDGVDYASAAVPVVGAWIDIAKGPDSTAHGFGDANDVLLIASGLLEAAGCALFITGLIVKHDVEVTDEPTVMLLPSLRPGSAGLTLSGRF